jgi:hypothetical protein
MLLTGGLVLIGDGSPTQIMLGILVCQIHIGFQLHALPLKTWEDNILQEAAAWQLVATLICGLWITAAVNVPPEQSVYSEAFANVILMALFIGTVMLFALFLCINVATARNITSHLLGELRARKRKKMGAQMGEPSQITQVHPAPAGLPKQRAPG